MLQGDPSVPVAQNKKAGKCRAADNEAQIGRIIGVQAVHRRPDLVHGRDPRGRFRRDAQCRNQALRLRTCACAVQDQIRNRHGQITPQSRFKAGHAEAVLSTKQIASRQPSGFESLGREGGRRRVIRRAFGSHLGRVARGHDRISVFTRADHRHRNAQTTRHRTTENPRQRIAVLFVKQGRGRAGRRVRPSLVFEQIDRKMTKTAIRNQGRPQFGFHSVNKTVIDRFPRKVAQLGLTEQVSDFPRFGIFALGDTRLWFGFQQGRSLKIDIQLPDFVGQTFQLGFLVLAPLFNVEKTGHLAADSGLTALYFLQPVHALPQ